MTFFSDIPFERMMVQKPQYRREEGLPPHRKAILSIPVLLTVTLL
jgi:hypothetical protein